MRTTRTVSPTPTGTFFPSIPVTMYCLGPPVPESTTYTEPSGATSTPCGPLNPPATVAGCGACAKANPANITVPKISPLPIRFLFRPAGRGEPNTTAVIFPLP